MVNEQAAPPGPLAGVRVLDLTRVLSGPFGTLILGDLGADIIKVEEPGGGDRVRTIAPFHDGDLSHYFLAVNRNKRSIVVDLKSERGRDLILELVAHCDVLIENFRPDVMTRLGLEFDVIKAHKPDIVMCSISGFGRTGPLRDKPSFDLVTQARSGVMSITGEPEGAPTKMGLPMGDLGGGLWSAIAVLAALHHRDRTGEAQHIDLSLLEGMVGMLGYLGQLALLTGTSPGRVGSSHHNVVPYGRFEVADGHLVLALHVGNFWRKFCVAIDRPDLIEDPRFRTTTNRRDNRDILVPIIEDILRTKTRDEWSGIFDEADLPYAPILGVAEALAQEQLQDREILRTVSHPTAGDVKIVRPPVRFPENNFEPPLRPPPLLGEHTREVCRTILGWDDARIDELIEGFENGRVGVKPA
ncbi:MAG: CoA transferase [Actinophytocola sp.]|uniref:CaiB/BaiF CoA transferase family protein n=1 Tax=Actinophytocola sp. TaxID=1872138 RepID=UPI00132C1E6A|nr:CaiB/BaiF CoA-transferase family protein [Actinophytocola sp.]MPZ85785.1 CoA transferase [Actinophytocola sp.]